jgi:outer membrane assembly lipoprotein YfiO
MICAVLAAGCGGRFKPQNYLTPETLLEASKQEFRQGSFGNAKTGLTRVTLELAANDPLLAEARYFLAESYFAQSDYLEASREFRRVADEFPTHPLAPEALLRAGDASAALWSRPELDPTYGEAALATYRELVGRFPQAPATVRAQRKLAVLAERFAEKDYRNGLFYLRLGGYDSAIIYFRSVAANYPQARVAADALVKLIEAYRRIGYAEERRETCAHLRRYYPGADGLDAACPLETPSP